jgi:hypothetical protein
MRDSQGRGVHRSVMLRRRSGRGEGGGVGTVAAKHAQEVEEGRGLTWRSRCSQSPDMRRRRVAAPAPRLPPLRRLCHPSDPPPASHHHLRLEAYTPRYPRPRWGRCWRPSRGDEDSIRGPEPSRLRQNSSLPSTAMELATPSATVWTVRDEGREELRWFS